MTREEWYAHTTLDHVQALSDYLDIVRDGAIDTSLSDHEIDNLYRYLIVLNCDINRRLNDLNGGEA